MGRTSPGSIIVLLAHFIIAKEEREAVISSGHNRTPSKTTKKPNMLLTIALERLCSLGLNFGSWVQDTGAASDDRQRGHRVRYDVR